MTRQTAAFVSVTDRAPAFSEAPSPALPSPAPERPLAALLSQEVWVRWFPVVLSSVEECSAPDPYTVLEFLHRHR